LRLERARAAGLIFTSNFSHLRHWYKWGLSGGCQRLCISSWRHISRHGVHRVRTRAGQWRRKRRDGGSSRLKAESVTAWPGCSVTPTFRLCRSLPNRDTSQARTCPARAGHSCTGTQGRNGHMGDAGQHGVPGLKHLRHGASPRGPAGSRARWGSSPPWTCGA